MRSRPRLRRRAPSPSRSPARRRSHESGSTFRFRSGREARSPGRGAREPTDRRGPSSRRGRRAGVRRRRTARRTCGCFLTHWAGTSRLVEVATSQQRTAANEGPLAVDELRLLDGWWGAANSLSVGPLYLLDNPLLRRPLEASDTKPRLLGHFGTTPGLNLVYAHLNRAIKARDLDAIYITGPGHGGPGLVASAYLEGTYSEVYAQVGPGEDGLRELFRQFSFPGGIPSHVAPETPGSIHEGGELGYALAHAYGAAYDNPDLLVCCVVGDGEAETGPLA